jgi:metal-sulfur cluster biosynthetic enzyme
MSETEFRPTPQAVSPAIAPLEDVIRALKGVVDPGLGVNVVDLGLVYGLEYERDSTLLIRITLTSPAFPLTGLIEQQVARALDGVVGGWRLSWVWMPPWGPERITEEGREQMRGFKA